MQDNIPVILVIDDDPDILMVLRANLEMHGFELHTAESLTSARELLAQFPPDLVLLDLMLPDGDGMDFCCYIKTRFSQLPVIMLTARDKLADKVEGLELGADDYVVKPFEMPELLARIRARLRSGATEQSLQIISAGEVELDMLNHTARVRGQDARLTPKQFDILAQLVQSDGNLVTRNQIRDRVWKESKPYSWSRVIDVHIQHLRQKIEIDPASPQLIITVAGRGYRFQETSR